MRGYSDVTVGQPVPPVEFTPDAVGLLRFGAVTRNTHRIHYDTAFARSEGLADPVVMAQLHGCLFHRAAAALAGETGRVREVAWQNRAPAHPGDRLVVTGTVREIDPARGEVTLDLVERCAAPDGEDLGIICCRGHAVVVLA
ncbi:acyl dehydratase [Streptomyces sp. HC44]|uniref:Acyl dehydratase n=1 Tax=Streptomyces scabichelini TaxID=2711217 RepID=A0A6G4V9E5_9ACTN|nr:acyl dehydratase [Streptomyces scabichelini]NGO10591.1 acyl dehydratase [Streptomyces scabichelini]